MTDPNILAAAERAMLEALAGLPERFGLYDALGVALPPKPSGPRMGGRRRWSAQWESALKHWDALKQADVIRIVGYDAECRGNLYVITPAGRAALAAVSSEAEGRHPGQWSRRDRLRTRPARLGCLRRRGHVRIMRAGRLLRDVRRVREGRSDV